MLSRLRTHLARPSHRYYLGTIALLLITIMAFLTGAVGAFIAHDRLVQIYGPHGLVEPPLKALTPAGGSSVGNPDQRGLGGVVPSTRRTPAPGVNLFLPTAADISQDNPPVGNQGSLNSCVSWAFAYTIRGWYATRYGRPMPRSGAPMYLYSQIVRGINTGTTFQDNLDRLMTQGVADRLHYSHGDYDDSDQPTASDRQNAAHYKISGWTWLFSGGGQGYPAQSAIEAAIASGNPVAIEIPVYRNFYEAGPSSYYVPGALGTYYGEHAVAATKYDANGVWIQNQWGTNWGLGGWAELSWSFVQRYVSAAIIVRVPHPAVVTPTPRPTPRPTIKPTARPTARPTAMPTTRPTVRPTPKPTPHGRIYVVIHAQYLRSKPATTAITHILEKVGTKLVYLGQFTPHWQRMRDPRGHTGWFLRSNVRHL